MSDQDAVRYELYCGQERPHADLSERDLYRERIEQHAAAKDVADQLRVHSFFEESVQHGVRHADGYVYAPANRALEVLRALMVAGVEVDIADVPVSKPEVAREIAATGIVSNIEPVYE